MPNNLPVLVRSPLRFAVVAPGNPQPVVLLASTEDNSDLVGSYSIREMGLDFSSSRRRGSSLLFIMTSDPAIVESNEIDIWAKASGAAWDIERRERAIALIVQGPPLSTFTAALRRRAISALENVLNEIEAAYVGNDIERITYLGTVLAASLANLRTEVLSRYRRLRSEFRVLVFTYGAAIALMITAALLQFLLPSFRLH
jgi:hypothetical protein